MRRLAVWLGAGARHRAQMLALRRSRAEQRRMREALRQAEFRFRHLADSLPELVWSSDARGKVDYYNQRHNEFSGFAQRADGGWDWQQVVHPEDRQRTIDAWARALQTGTVYENTHRVRRADGEYRWFLSRAVPVRDEGGQVVRWFGTATDIHEQKRAEAALRAADLHKDEFLAMLSHELRNPLAPIRSSVYVLEHGDPMGEPARRAREVIDRQVRHMVHLVDDLLDVTRISRGKIRLQRSEYLLNDIVQRTAEDHRALFDNHGVALTTSVCEDRLLAHVDATRIAQAIGNLLQNAAKFTPRGEKTHLSLRWGGDGVAIIEVRDSGPGLSPAVMERLFQPFVQGEDTLHRSRGGLGLGLALVKGLVELHGGAVSVSSDGPGTGACFSIRLPAQHACAPRVPAGGRPPRARFVLVIEENRDAAESLCEVLSLSGHCTVMAFDGREGIARARLLKPDLVLCDLRLPGVDGFEVARTLRDDPALKDTRLVALGEPAAQVDMGLLREAGFDDHIGEPQDARSLEALMTVLSARPG